MSHETHVDPSGSGRKGGFLSSLLDRDREQDLHEQARLELEQARADVLEAREKLSALMGLWGRDTEFRLPGRLPDPPHQEIPEEGLESAAISRRFDLAVSWRETEASAREAGITRLSTLLPSLTPGAHNEHEPDGTNTAGPSLEIAIPLFDQGQARNARAAALLRQAQERYAALAVEIRSQVRAARNRMTSARRRVEHYRRTVLPLRERIVRESQLQYNAMQVGVFQLLQAKQEQVEAGRRYVEALRDYWIARTELERALGGRLPDVDPSPSPSPASGGRALEHEHHEHK